MALRNALVFVVWLLVVALSSAHDAVNRATTPRTIMYDPMPKIPSSAGGRPDSLPKLKLEPEPAVSPAAIARVKQSFPSSRDQFIKEIKKWSVKAAKKLLKEALKEWLDSYDVIPFCTLDELQALHPSGFAVVNVEACTTDSGYYLGSGVQPTLMQQQLLCLSPVCSNLLDPIVRTVSQPCGFLNGHGVAIVRVMTSVFDSCSSPPLIQVKASSVNMPLPEMRGAASTSGSSTGPSSVSSTADNNSTSPKESTGTITSPRAVEKTVPTPSPSRSSSACTSWATMHAATFMTTAALAVVLA